MTASRWCLARGSAISTSVAFPRHGRAEFADMFPQASDRSKWYRIDRDKGVLCALGIHGQYLFVDRQNQLVVVMMSSQANPLDAELISLTMTAVSHFREIFALSQ